jgi:glycosyltransferase involved in cell wall biosynthesis
MRIAQISTLSAPVRQQSGGSVEAFVWLLTRELDRLGHEVTVFATGDSQLPGGKLVAALSGPYGSPGSLDDWYLCEWANLCRAIERSGDFDLLHSHAYLWGLPLEPLARAAMVHTTHIVPDDNAAALWGMRPSAKVSALSEHQWSAFPRLKPAAVIPHGVDTSQFTFRPQPDDYVCYLGRFVSGKGPLQAIATARKLGVHLLMAGPPNPYFREHIKPLVDGRAVEYVGYVSGADRDRLLGGAKALLYPIQHPEAFGLVLVEAMLCGTPAAAMHLGAVPEIIEEGVTGFTATNEGELAHACTRCFSLDRARIRSQAEQRFSVERMARDYLQLYKAAAVGDHANHS